jgi:hypothetical protein
VELLQNRLTNGPLRVPRVGHLDKRPPTEAAAVVHRQNSQRPRRRYLRGLVLAPFAGDLDDESVSIETETTHRTPSPNLPALPTVFITSRRRSSSRRRKGELMIGSSMADDIES